MGEESVVVIMEHITVDHIPSEATKSIISLASSWGDIIDENSLEVIPLTGAMTNQVYQVKWVTQKKSDQKEVIVRIYGGGGGDDGFFNREDEINTFECVSKHGQGPRLLGRFSTGRIEEFIHARTLSAHDLRDPEVSSLVASKLKEFHKLQMPGPKNVMLWNRLRNWLSSAKRVCPQEEADKVFMLDSLDDEINVLEKEISGENQLIGFCHNDLQYGNIMMDEDTNVVTIIDYEYASYNPVAYDLANHFCEMAADYHTETPHILDFNKYPDSEERKRFTRAYLSSSGDQPTDVDVDALVEDVEKYTLASNLVWGLWGIISAHANDIDFDYMEYAKQRFQQYQLRKAKFLLIDSSNAMGVVIDCP
ncbi:hypothetical protein MKW94_006830 [Papaver nudicaule]|uniref:Choline kinase n=1 Tax=Papaver nudicaule TaxID=74823 RepID=A0AA41RXY1_PAPNU|nr:hypothetical protein [Papaver nudicaule]